MRSRAAYKLMEIDDRAHFLRKGARVVDLGAAPGGWSQVAAQRVGAPAQGRVVAIDILPMDPVPGVDFVSLDFLDQSAPEMLTDMDLVLIDAPCTGTGAWRRNPDAKWRMRPGALEQRQKEQAEVLDRAISLLKPDGRIAYITCSVLEEENGAQVRAFLGRNPSFAFETPGTVVQELGERAFVFSKAARLSEEGILMTPRLTGTDGFFVSILRRGN